MQQQLAFIDPTGRVYIVGESNALPPLADDYEWTFVMRPVNGAQAAQEPAPAAASAPETAETTRQPGGILDVVIPLLTPRDDQSPQERAKELLDALPEGTRGKLAKLIRALAPPRPIELPPFPGARE